MDVGAVAAAVGFTTWPAFDPLTHWSSPSLYGLFLWKNPNLVEKVEVTISVHLNLNGAHAYLCKLYWKYAQVDVRARATFYACLTLGDT